MRDIKFRGKRENGVWVVGCYAISKIPLMPVEHIIIENGFKPNVVDPETVGQYTGLKDRNGVEIYEGEKLGRKSPNTGETYYYDVVWEVENARFMAVGKTIQEMVSTALERGYVSMGNIYESKEE